MCLLWLPCYDHRRRKEWSRHRPSSPTCCYCHRPSPTRSNCCYHCRCRRSSRCCCQCNCGSCCCCHHQCCGKPSSRCWWQLNLLVGHSCGGIGIGRVGNTGGFNYMGITVVWTRSYLNGWIWFGSYLNGWLALGWDVGCIALLVFESS